MDSFNPNDSIESISAKQSSSIESTMSGSDYFDCDSPCCSKDIIRSSSDYPSSVSDFPKIESCSMDMVHKPIANVGPMAKENEEAVEAPKVDASLASIARGSSCNVVTSGADEETKNHTVSSSQAVPAAISHIELKRVSVVLPMVVKEPLSRYLKVIQNQNEGLKTDQWSVAEHTVLDPDSEEYYRNVIYSGVENRVAVIHIDNESAKFLKRTGLFKFMFWKIPVNFKPTL